MKIPLPKDGPRGITDIGLLQELMIELLNELAEAREQLAQSQDQLQAALDEINRLKKEKGRPKFSSTKPKGKVKKLPKTKSSSDSESSPTKEFSSPTIDRVELVNTRPDGLPDDAQFKGYRSVIQRDIRVVRDNVEYRISRWYSPRMGKTYEATLPDSYRGQIGSNLLSLVQMLHHCGDMTHGRISDLLTHLGIPLSKGGISNMLTQSEWVEAEQADLLKASLQASPYVQLDSTMSKQAGERLHTQIISGQYFSLFYTLQGRSRMDVYAALQGQSRQQVRLAYTPLAIDRMKQALVSKKHLAFMEQSFSLGQRMTLTELEAIFDKEAVFAKTNKVRRSVIAGALAAGYYHEQTEVCRAKYIMTDEAAEYGGVAATSHMLCWIHEIRHYRKMVPRINYHRNILADFMERLWQFYGRIKSYKDLSAENLPSQKQAIVKTFNELFNGQTDYAALNKVMLQTQEKAVQLLAFLDYPAFPLHNNVAERGARRVVRKRYVSFHTWSERGTKIRDAFMSLHQTANKLGVSFMDYLLDRNSGKSGDKTLAELVTIAYRKSSTDF